MYTWKYSLYAPYNGYSMSKREPSTSRPFTPHAYNILQTLFRKYGADLVYVMWEDVSRFLNSEFGYNISDVTLSVGDYLLPVAMINTRFKDVTMTIDASKFYLVVGNCVDKGVLSTVSLKSYLSNIGDLEPTLKRPGMSMFGVDTNVVIKHVVVPVPSGCEVRPIIYNYQTQDAPRNLIVMSCHLGTSVEFSKKGKQFMNLRKVDNGKIVDTTIKVGVASCQQVPGGPKKTVLGTKHLGKSSDTIMIIQIPLMEQKSLDHLRIDHSLDQRIYRAIGPAFISHGSTMCFRGHDAASAKHAQRDMSKPVRVTVIKYVAIDTPCESDVKLLVEEITARYEDPVANWVGSLVTQESHAGDLEPPHNAPQVNDEYIRALMSVNHSASDMYPSDSDI